jgi:hypothetical protein
LGVLYKYDAPDCAATWDPEFQQLAYAADRINRYILLAFRPFYVSEIWVVLQLLGRIKIEQYRGETLRQASFSTTNIAGYQKSMGRFIYKHLDLKTGAIVQQQIFHHLKFLKILGSGASNCIWRPPGNVILSDLA